MNFVPLFAVLQDFIVPIAALLVALALSLIITRVATMALMLTGLSRESARFQARSAFTGVGFTTTEAESVIGHPVRRHIIMMLMLLGNVGIATFIASLMITMLRVSDQTQNTTDWARGLGLLAAGLFLIWAAASSRWVEKQLNRPIAFALRRFTHLDVRDYVSLLELASGFTVSELGVEPEDWIADRTLEELCLSREGILVLGIRRKNGNYLGAPSGTSRVCAHDTLVIYGTRYRIEELDTRCCGPEGDAAHAAATQEYDDYLTSVQLDETITTKPSK